MLNISHSMFARCCNCGLSDVGKFLGRYYEHWVNMLSDIKPDEVVAQFYQLIVPQLHPILWPWHCDQRTCKIYNPMKASFLYGVFGHVTWLHPCVIININKQKNANIFWPKMELSSISNFDPVLHFNIFFTFTLQVVPIYRTDGTGDRRINSTQHLEYMKNIILTLYRCGIHIDVVLTPISYIQHELCIAPSSHSSSIDVYF